MLAVLLLGAAHAASFHRYLTDDAFISFRYLDHWLAGEGLVYNAGERVWGFTNFGWIALLAPLRWLGADPVRAAQAVGLLSTAATAALVCAGPRRVREVPAWSRIAALALLASNGGFLLQAWSGLETALFTALALASLAAPRASSTAGTVGAALLAAAATLTRPEGVLVFGALVAAVLQQRRAPPRRLRRDVAVLVAAYAAPVLACGLALGLYYGSPWPNSITAKVDGSPEQLRRGAHYVATYLLHYPGQGAVLLLAGARFARLDAGDRSLALLCAAFLLFAAAAGGDWMFGYRLLHPATALACALVPGLAASLRPAPGRTWRRVAAVAFVAVLALHTANSWTDFRIAVARTETYVHQGIRIGRWMREHLPPGTLLATNTAGTIPYYSRLPVVDMMGLNDRAIATRHDVPEAWKGIEKGDGRYVLSRRPDFIHLGSSLGARTPMFLSGIELFLEPEFHRRYDLVLLDVAPDIQVRIYRRRAVPRADPPPPEVWRRIRQQMRERIRRSRYRY